MTDPVILGFDTSGPHCAAALRWGSDSMATRFEDMAKGQAERLMVVLEEILEQQRVDWTDLSAVAVGVGPGNFTGIRIAVSAARGLALGLGIPAIAISNFEILRGPYSDMSAQLASLPAPRGSNYVQRFEGGKTSHPALLLKDPTSPPPELTQAPVEQVLGNNARDIAHALGPKAAPKYTDATIQNVPQTLIRIATAKWRAGLVDGSRPAPLYVKPPDAAPARTPAPKVVG